MFRTVVYLLFFLLFIVVGKMDYSPKHHTHQNTSNTTSYRQPQHPCKRAINHILFINRFADFPQMVISVDNPDHSKLKSSLRILAARKEHQKQNEQEAKINFHISHSLHANALDYYIYTLRRIII